jgi:hypothetical protein
MPKRRTIAMIAGALLLVIATAATTYGTVSQDVARPLNRQNLGVIKGPPRTTHSTSFKDLGGWGLSDGLSIDARAGLAATLSVTVSGGPVEFRILTEDVNNGFAIHNLPPGPAHFDPGTGTQSVSFTWVSGLAAGRYTVNIAWRSPTGAIVTLDRGSLVVQYGARVP